MKRITISILGLILAFFSAPLLGEGEGKMFQVTPFSSFMEGGFDGYYSVGELSKEGNFGMGCYSQLDGLFLAYKGKFYQINSKGQVKGARKRWKVCYAQMTQFSPEYTFDLENTRNYKLTCDAIHENIKTQNLPVAIVIKGTFYYLKLHSFKTPKNQPENLEEALKEQGNYHYQEVEGYVIGFWTPDYWGNITAPGYQFFFLCKTLKKGGYIKDMHLKSGEVQVMPIQNMEFFLPDKPSFDQLNLK